MSKLKTYTSRLARDERGSPAVEFALVAPMLILLMLAIVQFGFVFYTYNEMMNGAREGARRLAVGATVLSAEQRAQDTMVLHTYEIISDPGDPAVTMTVKLKVSDAMVIAKLESFEAFYPAYLTASVTMHRE